MFYNIHVKTIYLIRHSGPFVEIDNYTNKNVLWSEFNRNMILSPLGEMNAKNLCNVKELKNISAIYASNSARAIGTAKYLAEINKLKIKLDTRINEREFGVDYIQELPSDFTKHSFDDKNFKLAHGESLNQVDTRLKSFINDLLDSNNDKVAIVLHGIILLSYLKTVSNHFYFDGVNFDIKFNNNVVLTGIPKNPSIYKIEFNDNKKVCNLEQIEF